MTPPETTDSTTPTKRVFKAPDATSVTSAVGGVPLAVATVWVLINVCHWQLDTTAAVAFGSLGAVCFGEIGGTLKRLLDHIAPEKSP